jgi:hypothetical protein
LRIAAEAVGSAGGGGVALEQAVKARIATTNIPGLTCASPVLPGTGAALRGGAAGPPQYAVFASIHKPM